MVAGVFESRQYGREVDVATQQVVAEPVQTAAGLLSKTLCQEVIGREFGFEALLKHTDQNGAMIKDHGIGSGPFTMG